MDSVEKSKGWKIGNQFFTLRDVKLEALLQLIDDTPQEKIMSPARENIATHILDNSDIAISILSMKERTRSVRKDSGKKRGKAVKPQIEKTV